MKFNELKLEKNILKALKEAGYSEPTPIQQQAIPPVLEGRDLMGCAQTGTGKTCAFAVPIIQRLAKSEGKKVYAAKAILKAVGRAEEGINVVSCPTCGRTRINLIDIAKEVEQRCQSIRGKKMKVAVMGCVVNGPGEAREADLGIAGGDGVGLIFRRGEIIKKVPQEQLVDALMDEIAHYEGE